MNRMIAATTDERYAPGLAMIEENANLTARVRALEKQAEFYRRMWELELADNEALRDQLCELNREVLNARAAGVRAERRRRDPYIRRIYGTRV